MYAVRTPTCFDGSRFLPGGATVLVADGRVAGVEPFGCDLPEGCELASYDGTLLPGLVDSHVHLVTDSGPDALGRVAGYSAAEIDDVVTEALRRHLAAGVTTVRDLGDRDFTVVERRDRQAAGGSPGRPPEPHIVASGPPVTVPGGHCHFLGGVAQGVDQLRAAVRDRVDRGVDVVKVMASGGMVTLGSDVFGVQFDPDELRTLVEAAHALDLRVLAHAHSLAGIQHALDAGVDGIEHFTGLTAEGVHMPDEVLDRIAAAGVVVDPTLGFDRAGLASMPELPPGLAASLRAAGLDFETAYADRLEVLARAHARGVRLISGSDAGVGPLKRHGSVVLGVIDLPAAGLSTEEALATATSSAAAACGLERETGRLAPGLAADLLAVDGDLRSDLEPLRFPTSVLVRGHEVTTAAR